MEVVIVTSQQMWSHSHHLHETYVTGKNIEYSTQGFSSFTEDFSGVHRLAEPLTLFFPFIKYI